MAFLFIILSKRIFLVFLFFRFSIESAEASIKFLTQNLGGAQIYFSFEKGVTSTCPSYKLCDDRVIQQTKHFLLKHKPDLIHFQEVFSADQMHQMLPNGYQFECALSFSGYVDLCTAWVEKFHGNCHSENSDSGAVMQCLLIDGEKKIQSLNIHPSAWSYFKRIALIEKMWTNYFDPQYETIVGGDFNQEFPSMKSGQFQLFPKGFQTEFGLFSHQDDSSRGTGSFYGYFLRGRPVSQASTLFFERYDHVFSNLKTDNNLDFPSLMPCGSKVCLGGVSGFDYGQVFWGEGFSFGPLLDHKPVMVMF